MTLMYVMIMYSGFVYIFIILISEV